MTTRYLTTADAVLRLKAAITMVGSEQAFCDAHDFTRNYLRKVLRGARGLGPEILTAIGLEPVTLYKIKGNTK